MIVYNKNRCYLFTGLTSVGSDESSIGFMLVDMVTKKPYLYQMSGATDYAAQQSAKGKVQALRYQASFPLITNVDGIATYFMTLKDDAGLIKQYAFVSVSDYTTVGTGETVQDALDDYENALKGDGAVKIDAGARKQTLTGTVDRIASQITGGNTVYELILKEQPDKIFTAVAGLSPELALTREGDRVSLTYVVSGSPVLQASAFDNLRYAQK